MAPLSEPVRHVRPHLNNLVLLMAGAQCQTKNASGSLDPYVARWFKVRCCVSI